MRTTNSEGGMREQREAQSSILDTIMNTSKLCACFPCCRKTQLEEQPLDMEQMISEN